MCFSYNSMKQIDFSSPVDHLWSTFDDVVAPFCLPESTPRALGAQTWPISPKLSTKIQNFSSSLDYLWSTFDDFVPPFSRRFLDASSEGLLGDLRTPRERKGSCRRGLDVRLDQ